MLRCAVLNPADSGRLAAGCQERQCVTPRDNFVSSHILCDAAGELSSYQRAFAWQAVLVKHLMQEPDKEQLLNKQSLLLAEMLSTQAKHTPGLPEESRIELAIGAFLCSLRGTQQGLEVVIWLEQHVKVRGMFGLDAMGYNPCLH